MDDKLEAWDRLPNGNVALIPLLGGMAIPLTSGSFAVRLLYARDEAHYNEVAAGQSRPDAIQLGATLEQLEGLVAILQRNVDYLKSTASQSGSPN